MHDKPICECCEKEIACFIPKRCTECNKEALNVLEARLKREHIENILLDVPSFWYKSKSFTYMVLLYVIPLIIVGVTLGIKYEWAAIAGGIHMIIYRLLKDFLMEKF